MSCGFNIIAIFCGNINTVFAPRHGRFINFDLHNDDAYGILKKKENIWGGYQDAEVFQ
jgi:hypothetical protein